MQIRKGSVIQDSSNVKSIQSGSITIGAGSSSQTVNIGKVDLSRSIVICNTTNSTNSSSAVAISSAYTRASFQNDSTIVLSRDGTNGTATVQWYVIEYRNAKVQSGTSTITGTVIRPTISPVNIDRALPIISYSINYTSATAYVPAFSDLRTHLSSDSELTIVRGSSSNGTVTISWFVVEFN